MAGLSRVQGRKWQVTINNPLDHGFDHEAIKTALAQFKGLLYYCLCDEEGDECQTRHTHVFFVLRNPCTAERVNNLFPKMHRERAAGTCAENRAYVLKDGIKYNKQPDGHYSYTDSSGKDHEGIFAIFILTFQKIFMKAAKKRPAGRCKGWSVSTAGGGCRPAGKQCAGIKERRERRSGWYKNRIPAPQKK